jgi:hypothetical protein
MEGARSGIWWHAAAFGGTLLHLAARCCMPVACMTPQHCCMVMPHHDIKR